jgi:hypothetical protein
VTLHGYLDIRELARAAAGHSAIDDLIKQQREEHERMLHLHSSTATDQLYRMLGGIGAVEGVIEQARVSGDRAFDTYRHWVDRSALDLHMSQALDSLTSAVEAARRAGAFELPNLLQQYRVADTSLAAQLADAYRLPWWDDSYAKALNAHAALSSMLDSIDAVGREAWSAIDSVLSDSLLDLHSVRQVRELLNLSGLLRAPRYRILSRKEKRRHIQLLVKDNAMPAPVRKAQGLVHRYEKVLRVLIARRMETAYGEDWAKERLPLCECGKLLLTRQSNICYDAS